jgi:hypothetical protein
MSISLAMISFLWLRTLQISPILAPAIRFSVQASLSNYALSTPQPNYQLSQDYLASAILTDS